MHGQNFNTTQTTHNKQQHQQETGLRRELRKERQKGTIANCVPLIVQVLAVSWPVGATFFLSLSVILRRVVGGQPVVSFLCPIVVIAAAHRWTDA